MIRKYKSGSRWCIWRWSDIDSDHIKRLHIVKTPLFAVCLHWLKRGDPTTDLHDHPVSFISIVLRGEYWENRNGVTRRRRWANFFRASPDDCHRILDADALTLAIMGPKVREWGFHTDTGWIGWREYYAAQSTS